MTVHKSRLKGSRVFYLYLLHANLRKLFLGKTIELFTNAAMFFMKSEVLHIDFEYSWCMETGKILNPIGLPTFCAISETNVT